MQLANLTLRLGGSQLHTVPKTGVTPAEILVLQAIHGADATVNIRPTKVDRARSHAAEYERLANIYDKAASSNEPGEDRKSIMATLFPGALKKLPTTLKEIGMGHVMSAASIAAADIATVPTPPDDSTPIMRFAPEDDDVLLIEPEDGIGAGNLATVDD